MSIHSQTLLLLFAIYCVEYVNLQSNPLPQPSCSPGRGGSQCLLCPAGTYKTTWGTEACSACPRGTFSAQVGAATLYTCQVCSMGTYSATLARTECLPCPANTISPVGSTMLSDCMPKAGYYGPAGGDAQPCPATYYCPLGILRPIACPDGTFAATAQSTCMSTHVGDMSPMLSLPWYTWFMAEASVVLAWCMLGVAVLSCGFFLFSSSPQPSSVDYAAAAAQRVINVRIYD